MKHLFIFAAAVFALASCSKTQVVYNEAPQEINFKTVSGVMTKATNLPETEDLGVFASLYTASTSTVGEEYFGNTQFTYQTDSWTAGKYWPISEGLIFTVYSPYNNTKVDGNFVVTWDETNKKLVLPLADNTNTQTDLLYGITRPTGTRTADAINVTLGHALAMISVNVSSTVSNIVTLKSISINNTIQQGTCTVTYPTPTVEWPSLGSPVTSVDLNITETSLVQNTPVSKDYLVVPCTLTNQTLTITYTLSGSDEVLTYTTSSTPNNQLGTSWTHGKKYVYNIIITPQQIKFNATENDWDENTDIDGTVDQDNDHKDITI